MWILTKDPEVFSVEVSEPGALFFLTRSTGSSVVHLAPPTTSGQNTETWRGGGGWEVLGYEKY